jgi:nitrilase
MCFAHLGDAPSDAERLIDQAAAEGAQLVSLPEYFVQMGLRETDKFEIAEPRFPFAK